MHVGDIVDEIRCAWLCGLWWIQSMVTSKENIIDGCIARCVSVYCIEELIDCYIYALGVNLIWLLNARKLMYFFNRNVTV